MSDKKTKSAKAPRPLWRRILKWCSITALCLLGLFLLVCSLTVWMLTPSRLTPLVEREASAYLDADVKVKRVELTFWHTFPRMRLDVDSLQVISRSLNTLPDSVRATLPADADSLLSLAHFHGGVNVPRLLMGRVHLYDVTFEHPAANLLQVTDSVANYQILPTTEEADTSALSLPPITIDRFRIVDAAPLRFRSLIDSLDVSASLANVNLEGADAPQYTLSISGAANLPFLSEYRFDHLTFGMDGRLDWDSHTPMAIAARDVVITLDDYRMTLAAAADFSGNPRLTQFDASVDGIPVEDAMSHFPPALQTYLSPLHTDMRLGATVSLSRPWMLADTIFPSGRATLTIPQCSAKYQTLSLQRLQGKIEVDFDGDNPDASVFTLRGLRVAGEGMEFALDASATQVITDPKVEGHFRGNVNLAKLPPRLAQEIPVQLAGIVDGDATFRLRVSDINRENFHRILADGRLTFRNISAQAEGLITAGLSNGEIRFGTTDSFIRDGHKVDSLLQVSLKVDTLWANGMGMALEIKDLKAGAGTANRAASADTAEINPFGGSIAVQRLKFDSQADTMRVRLRDTRIGGALRRYNDHKRLPLIDLRVLSQRMMAGQALSRVSLSETNLSLTLHMRENLYTNAQNHSGRTRRARRDTDSTESFTPSLSPSDTAGNINMRLDREDRRLLRRWDFSGHLRATKGRFVTPYFPLKNRLRNIDLSFNSDSICLRDLRYTAGASDFTVNGTVGNLRRALTSRRDNALALSLDIRSDTVNVNEIVQALFAGGALASQTDQEYIWGDDAEASDNADNRRESQLAASADTVTSGPLLLPHNLDAHLRMRANNILYSDLELHRFRGDLILYDGALNLRNLSASTDLGTVAINGLYSSTIPDSLQFGLGMKISKFRLDRLSSLIPAIDSLMPALRDFAGIVDADVAVTTDLTPQMDIDIPSLRAAVKIEGDSLVLLDPDTFKTVSKWLLFKNKQRNIIDHMSVEAVIENSAVELYPFMFDIDRYRLGVMGHNDLAMNLNYHISVLKSPIPFKFGINIKGTPEKMKIRLGGAKFKENMVVERAQIADNTRVNLVEQIDRVFRRGVRNARLGRLNFTGRPTSHTSADDAPDPPLTHTDSLGLMEAGLIPRPDSLQSQ